MDHKKAEAERVNAVLEPILERPLTPVDEITVDTLLVELEEARSLAVVTGQPAAMKACTMGKAELLGFLVSRTETGAPGEFDHVRTREGVYALIEQKYGPQGLETFKQIIDAMNADTIDVEAIEATNGDERTHQ
jgi:hypothetical protein